MRRFELIEGTSSKFWSIEVSDTQLTTYYGRIGTNGQSKAKTFADNAAALKEQNKLIKEKTGKGYSEVAIAGGTTPTPAAVKPTVQTAAAKVPTAKEATITPVATPIAVTPPAITMALGDIPWPQSDVVLTNKQQELMPVMRGVHVPPFKASIGNIGNIPKFSDHEISQNNWEAMRQTGAPLQGDYWNYEQAKEKLARPLLLQKDLSYWQQIFYQTAAHLNRQNPAIKWTMEIAIALHGVEFALQVCLSGIEAVASNGYVTLGWRHQDSAFYMLRHAIAATDQAQWQACYNNAQTQRGQSQQLDIIISYLFPEQQDWAQQGMSYGLDYEQSWWLKDSFLSVENTTALLKKTPELYWAYSSPTVFLHIHLHGGQALPILETLLDRITTRDDTFEILRVIQQLQTPSIIPALISRFERREVKTVLDELVNTWPAACLKTAITLLRHGRLHILESWINILTLRFPQVLEQVISCLEPAEKQWLEGLLSKRLSITEAPLAQLPHILQQPPWLAGQRPAPLPELKLQAIAQATKMVWLPGEKEKALKDDTNTCIHWLEQRFTDRQSRNKNLTWEQFLLDEAGIRTGSQEKVLKGEPITESDLTGKYLSVDMFTVLPTPAALVLWSYVAVSRWNIWYFEGIASTFIAKNAEATLQGVLNIVAFDAGLGLMLALPMQSPQLVAPAANALANSKKFRIAAENWLLRHLQTAIIELIPQAFMSVGKAAERKVRDSAQYTLRWLAQQNHETAIHQAAAQYGKPAQQAVEQLLSIDPALIVPAKMPKLPGFFVVEVFHRPQLNQGGALSIQAMQYLGNMLSISDLDNPYGGLQLIRQACTANSLAEFAWDIFETWLNIGAPSKERWAFTALGLLGNDETARRLTPLIRQWPGESNHARAVTGLDILAMIGSDVALMHLNGIANKLKFKGLQNKAKEKIADIAQQRDLTADELADRLVPDLGLDDNGVLELNFGARRFYAYFDESLKPFVKDEQNTRLKDLPKPNSKDDAEASAESVQRWKDLKKDAKAIASIQLTRLEQIMCKRRQWSAESFRLFFLDHPLMRHLSQRLAWGVYRDGKFQTAFRVAEDLSLADCNDELYTLPEDAEVGVAHVLEMPQDLVADFGQLFADYEILQPFRQLGRETYALTDEERKTNTITRFKDKVVATGSLMGLTNRGWERGAAQDAGWIGWFEKRLNAEQEFVLTMDPGTVAGEMNYEPEQKITEISLSKPNDWNQKKLPLSELDPILISEAIRDADLLTAIK